MSDSDAVPDIPAGAPLDGFPESPGGGPPPGFLDPSLLPQGDRGPEIRAVVWVLTALAALFLGMRIYCKFLTKRGLHWDDWVLIASWITLVMDAVFTTIAVHFGHGKHTWNIDIANANTIATMGLISVTFAIIGQAWSKTSFGLTLLRISDGWVKWFIWFAIISLNIFLGLGALFFWVQCTPLEAAWKPLVRGQCWDKQVTIVYGIFASAYSGIMDLALAMLPWKIILGLQMKAKEKIGVAVAMSMGCVAGAAAFVKCSYLPMLGSDDFTYEGTPLVIWGAAEVSVTIMAACIPVMRVLVREVSTTRRYYKNGSGGDASQPGRGGAFSRNPHSGTQASSRWREEMGSSYKAHGSDKSISEGDIPAGKIVQTSEVAILRSSKGSDTTNNSWEMDKV